MEKRGILHRFVHFLQNALFVLTLLAGGLLFFHLPREQVSADEKRALAKAPALSPATVANGTFFDDTDAYYADHFIFRHFFIDLADRVKAARGMGEAEIEVYDSPDAADGNKPVAVVPGAAPIPDGEDLNAPYERVRSVIVTRGRAVQIFGGTPGMVEPFARMVNDYQRVLGPETRVYVVAFPAGSDMFLPVEVNKGVMKERANIDYLNTRLDPAVVRVDAYSALLQHRDEYIQFHTDHHWTGRGAYYAYTAFARAAGFQPIPMEGFERKEIPGFLGSLYYRTRDKTLLEKGDFVEYFKVPGETRAIRYQSGIEKGIPTSLYYERASGSNAYGVFLGGDWPMIRVVTGNQSGRKIAVVKDSYGNAFVPFLAAHYDELFILDYRYFKGSIPQLMRRYGINELAFAHNSFVMNTPASVSRGREMLKDPDPAPRPSPSPSAAAPLTAP